MQPAPSWGGSEVSQGPALGSVYLDRCSPTRLWFHPSCSQMGTQSPVTNDENSKCQFLCAFSIKSTPLCEAGVTTLS